jgi:rhamnulose-1-phosphate aldolase
MVDAPYPEIVDLLRAIGEAGRRVADIEASEGAAGNISVCLRWPVDPRTRFPVSEQLELPDAVPELAGACLLVTGSGRRLREIIDDPAANLGCILVDEGGRTGMLHTSHHRRFDRVTSEFNSHLAVHRDRIRETGTNFHAIIHAQPIYLTYLSHVPRYRHVTYLNTHLLRWQPETIVNLPEGIGVVPFLVPGSADLMAATIESLRRHRIVLWSKHGVMARSDVSIKRAADRVEYAETAAKYEYLNLSAGGAGEGLSAEEIREICATFQVRQELF